MATVTSIPAAPELKKRTQSDVKFPYYNLDSCVEVAEVIHREAGGTCDRSQLAAYLKYKSIANGSFLTRVTATKLFGYITQTGNKLALSDLGRTVAAPIATNDKERAKAEAFLNVELFKKIFDDYDGQTLPPALGLRNALLTRYGVIEARVGPAIKVFYDSAEQAGYFRGGDKGRLVRPVFAAVAHPVHPHANPPADATKHDEVKDNGAHRGGGGDGGDPPDIDPALVALLRRLPATGATLSERKRDALVSAFTAALKWLYPESEDL